MPIAVDLFAGAGGFSLGATLAGYEVTHALELDAWACDTLRANHPEARVLQKDITVVPDRWLATELPRYPDLLLGGPPCQGFSHAAVGRQDPKDPRNSLFSDFVRAVRVLEPRQVVMENVPGILRAKTSAGRRVADLIVDALSDLGYHVSVLILNAEQFGVPQLRRRVFFVADAERQPPDAIPPTHGVPSLFATILPVVTVGDAIGDLPRVDVGDVLDPVPYDRPPKTPFQEWARSGAGAAVHNHVPMRHTERMVARFRAIRPGESQSHVADEHAPRLRVRSASQGPGRFDQNNRRMHWDRPCHTVPATFYANFVHPRLHRNFTPREGARIQSFPDHYVFRGKATVVSQSLLAREGRLHEKHLCQYVQIGNAVPPLLARQLLRALGTSARASTAEGGGHGH